MSEPMPQLLPCPYCGTVERDDDQERGLDDWLQLSEMAGPLFSVECFGCGAETRSFDTAGEAIAAWNRRSGEASAPYGAPTEPAAEQAAEPEQAELERLRALERQVVAKYNAEREG